MRFRLRDSLKVTVFCLDPLRHVLRTFVGVVTQHAAGEIVPAMGIEAAATVFQALHQCGAVAVQVIATGQELAAVFLGLGPAFAVLVKAHGGIGQRRGAVGDCPRPRLLVAHGFGADRRGDVWCAAEHGVRQFALDPRTKAQRRQADARSRHHLQRIFGPVHHMKEIGRASCRERVS